MATRSTKSYTRFKSSAKDVFQGGGDKPITDNQINFILRITKERGINIKGYMISKGIRDFYVLKGRDADAIIKDIMKYPEINNQ